MTPRNPAPMHYLDPAPHNPAPVLLLHGLGATAASWEAQLPALAHAGFRPIAVDLPGFGQTPHRGPWTPQRAAAAALALLESLHALPAHIVGISMGGTVALAAALDFPESVRSLVLVNTFAALRRPDGLRGWAYFAFRMALVHTLGLEAQGRVVAKRIFPKAGQEALRAALLEEIRQADPRAYRAAMRALVRFDARPRLREIRVPVLVVTGEEDTTVPPEVQRDLARGIPHARQVIIPGAGHGIIADSPAAFNRTLLDFLLTPDT